LGKWSDDCNDGDNYVGNEEDKDYCVLYDDGDDHDHQNVEKIGMMRMRIIVMLT
jgi:hypothetical protein